MARIPVRLARVPAVVYAGPMSEMVMPRRMTLDEFTPLIGREFEADCAPKVALLTLVEARPARWIADPERPGFVLLFRSSPAILLIGASYVMRCGSFGPDTIGIEPVIAAPGAAPGHYYEAVFN